jgi:hypothetical protein
MFNLITMLVACWLGYILVRFGYGLIQRLVYRFSTGGDTNLFGSYYLDTKALYLQKFRRVPCTTIITELDVTKSFAWIRENHGSLIMDVFQFCHFNREKGVQEFNKTVFVLRNKVIIELWGQVAELLYGNRDYAFADELLRGLSQFRTEQKLEEFEINIIASGSHGLELKRLEIKPTRLDIDLFYNDDFKPVDELVRQRVGQAHDKGIILFHGLPGTGKTTYLRHLIGGLNKKVLFVSPSVADNLMNPDFIDLLIDNPNAVLVIEDAENIIMDRKVNSSSSVSNLLNLSDGLLSDCLNVQIICTFNSSLSLVDDALIRKGRLIARYEFGKLDVEKARRLSDHLGLNQVIRRPMTLAEITNPGEPGTKVKPEIRIGFRTEMMES